MARSKTVETLLGELAALNAAAPRVAVRADASARGWQSLVSALTALRDAMPATDWEAATRFSGIPELLRAGHVGSGSAFRGRRAGYPAEATSFLESGAMVRVAQLDVQGWWLQANGELWWCHAHPEGFWALRSPAAFLEAALKAVKTVAKASARRARLAKTCTKGLALAAAVPAETMTARELANHLRANGLIAGYVGLDFMVQASAPTSAGSLSFTLRKAADFTSKPIRPAWFLTGTPEKLLKPETFTSFPEAVARALAILDGVVLDARHLKPLPPLPKPRLPKLVPAALSAALKERKVPATLTRTVGDTLEFTFQTRSAGVTMLICPADNGYQIEYSVPKWDRVEPRHVKDLAALVDFMATAWLTLKASKV